MSDNDSLTTREWFESLTPEAQSLLLAAVAAVPSWWHPGSKIKQTAGAVVVFVRLYCLHRRAGIPARKAIYWSLAFAKALFFWGGR